MRNTVKGIVVSVVVAGILLTVGLVAGVFAQGGPGGPGGPMPRPMHAMMKAGTDALFVLAGPNLVKYDGKTLEQVGTLPILPKPTEPAQQDRPMGPPPMAMIIMPAANGIPESVIILAGDLFTRVDAAGMKIAAQSTLPKPELPAPPDQGSMQGPPPMMPGGLELKGSTLYIQRGPEILAVNVGDGKVLGTATLPKPQLPQ